MHYVVDATHWLTPSLELPDGPPALRRKALHLARIIEQGAHLPPGATHQTLIECPLRPNRKPCGDLLVVAKRPDDILHAFCPRCGEQDWFVSNWQKTPWAQARTSQPARPRAERPKRPSGTVRLHVSLQEIEPRIWRRVDVPADFSFAELHLVLAVAMGWANTHLHEFSVRGRRIGIKDPDFDFGGNIEDERTVRLGECLAQAGDRFEWAYDFGDGWTHDVEVEELRTDERRTSAVCLAGERACPPEDCGGPYGYMELLEILRNPGHRDHDHMVEWIGGPFEPEAFDLRKINARLAALCAQLRPAAETGYGR